MGEIAALRQIYSAIYYITYGSNIVYKELICPLNLTSNESEWADSWSTVRYFAQNHEESTGQTETGTSFLKVSFQF